MNQKHELSLLVNSFLFTCVSWEECENWTLACDLTMHRLFDIVAGRLSAMPNIQKSTGRTTRRAWPWRSQALEPALHLTRRFKARFNAARDSAAATTTMTGHREPCFRRWASRTLSYANPAVASSSWYGCLWVSLHHSIRASQGHMGRMPWFCARVRSASIWWQVCHRPCHRRRELVNIVYNVYMLTLITVWGWQDRLRLQRGVYKGLRIVYVWNLHLPYKVFCSHLLQVWIFIH